MNHEDESTLLGLILENPALLADAGSLEPRDFVAAEHGRALEAMRAVQTAGHGLDALTLKAELQRAGLEKPGALLAALMGTPRRDTLEPFLSRVRDSATRRRALTLLGDVREELSSETCEALESVSRAIERFGGLFDSRREERTTVEGAALRSAASRAVESWMSPSGQGLSTGFPGLDRLDVRLVEGEVIVLAAGTSKGKSALAGQIAYTVAKGGARVLFVSGEMSEAQMLRRFVAYEGGVALGNMRRFREDSGMLQRISGAIGRLPKGLIVADMTRDTRLSRIVTEAQSAKTRGGLDVLVIDYLGLLRLDDERGGMSPYERVTRLSREVKLAAARLGVGVLLLAQLSRLPERREGGDTGPLLSDLRDSGAIEQDADSVVMIHRKSEETEGKLLVRKNRNGRLGAVDIVFFGDTFKTVERSEEEPAA